MKKELKIKDMKKQKTIRIIRVILTLAMCYFIYTETGIFTAVFAAIIGIESELNSIIITKILESIKILSGFHVPKDN